MVHDSFRQSKSIAFHVCLYFVILVVWQTKSGNVAHAQTAPKLEDAPKAKRLTFDEVGPQVGDQLPDLRLITVKNEPQKLSDAWKNGPALLVTSSFTCPKSRSRWPELESIAKRYDSKLNIVIIYVIEAHPVGSVCPYKDVEDITEENQRDNILRKQPNLIDGRLDLAMEFKRYLRIDLPIYVDTIENQAWKAFGAAPNIAFLVDPNGIVKARQGWFDGPALEKAIDALLEPPPEKELEPPEIKAKGKAKNRPKVGAVKVDGAVELNSKLGTELRRSLYNTSDTTELNVLLNRYPVLARHVFPIAQGHPKETTCLMEAIKNRNLKAAEVVLAAGADIATSTKSYTSALQLAAEIGQLEMVLLLLQHKADVNVPTRGNSPLHQALIHGHIDVAKTLLTAGANEDLYSSIGFGKAEAVRSSLALDPSRASRPDGNGRMPLDYAAVLNHCEIAKLVLDLGAPVVRHDVSTHMVPIHYALKNGNLEMVELLLKAGNSPNTVLRGLGETPTSVPPLHMIPDDRIDLYRLLLAHKADTELRNTYSETALHRAAGLGLTVVCQILLEAGADVHSITKEFHLPCGPGGGPEGKKYTPLHFAAASGNPSTIEVLLKCGAKINAPSIDGLTPLMSAIEPPMYTQINVKDQLENVNALLSAGADIRIQNKEGINALKLARIKLHQSKRQQVGTEDENSLRTSSLVGVVDSLSKHAAN